MMSIAVQDSHATFGGFRNRNQTIFRWRCRLSQNLSYVLGRPPRLEAAIKRKRDDVEIPTKQCHPYNHLGVLGADKALASNS